MLIDMPHKYIKDELSYRELIPVNEQMLDFDH